MRAVLFLFVVLLAVGLIALAVTESGPVCSKTVDCVGVSK